MIKASDITAVNVSGDVVRYKRDNEKPLDFDDDRDGLNYQCLDIWKLTMTAMSTQFPLF